MLLELKTVPSIKVHLRTYPEPSDYIRIPDD
jgi:hypothetical protein